MVPGYLADLVVLSEDPLDVDAEQLEAIEPVLTIVGGRVGSAAEGWPAQ
ncbi:MAG: amidohydrolase family protein [Gemmatimonadota bacterium]